MLTAYNCKQTKDSCQQVIRWVKQKNTHQEVSANCYKDDEINPFRDLIKVAGKNIYLVE